ncbi:MAG: peroxiredoxin-like family protein [Pyrinomonadaceae bacterium]
MMKKNILLMMLMMVFGSMNLFGQDSMTAMVSKNKMVSDTDAAKSALNVGAKMPSFELLDSNKKTVKSDDLLKKGNLVLVFYRGAWCPFCNLYLKNLQKNLGEIQSNGGVLTAISVENADTSMTVSKKNELNFSVLSDPKLETARKFKIVYQLPDATNEKYKTYGVDLVKQNETETPDLPLSATYIVNQKGEIVYAFLEPDYKKRAEPAKIIEVLKTLNKSMKK